jgi:hypothetical protein
MIAIKIHDVEMLGTADWFCLLAICPFINGHHLTDILDYEFVRFYRFLGMEPHSLAPGRDDLVQLLICNRLRKGLVATLKVFPFLIAGFLLFPSGFAVRSTALYKALAVLAMEIAFTTGAIA